MAKMSVASRLATTVCEPNDIWENIFCNVNLKICFFPLNIKLHAIALKSLYHFI